MAVATATAVAPLLSSACRLIYKIVKTAKMARQNKDECADLAGRLSVIGSVLGGEPLEGPETAKALAGLCDALEYAHEIVDACCKSSGLMKFAFASDQAGSLKSVNERIMYHLGLIKFCCQVDLSRCFYLKQIISPAKVSPRGSRSPQPEEFLRTKLNKQLPQAAHHGQDGGANSPFARAIYNATRRAVVPMALRVNEEPPQPQGTHHRQDGGAKSPYARAIYNAERRAAVRMASRLNKQPPQGTHHGQDEGTNSPFARAIYNAARRAAVPIA